MRNIDKYEKEILKISKNTGQSIAINKSTKEIQPCGETECSNCLFSNRFEGYCNYLKYKWLLAEYKEPILDDVEKRYLESVISPFKDRVNYIVKSGTYSGEEYIYISIRNWEQSKNYSGINILQLPFFKSYTMYKGMEKEKEYTLKELGLFEGGKQ